jgi:putative ABC transport system ATP-binding protein/lipoprotein-releasing system ATP-binding protein
MFSLHPSSFIPHPFSMSSPHLTARGLKQTYALGAERLEILKGIDLDVGRGEVLFLRGASGAGKSTLLYILAALEHPRAGSVEFEGEQLLKLGSDRLASLRNRRMGFIFQSYHLLPELTALENVLLPSMLGGSRREERARSLLDRVGLSGRLDHLPSQLSGGEQQRVAIARALANDPGILFADEPTGNLDATTGAGIIELLLGLAREDGRTMIAVTHDAALAALGDRQLFLCEGLLQNP